MTVACASRLVLWDIDHTLIESRGAGRLIYERVFPEVTGQPLRELVALHGRTELDIMHSTLALHGIEPTEPILKQLAATLADGYRQAVDEVTRRGRVLPGVRDALGALAREPGIHQSVLTGNTADIARIKLEAFGLNHYLDLALGAYGDDHRDRPDLVGIACKRAARRLGTTVEANQVLLVGDTPNDVRAALVTGAQIIAVATGEYSTDDLRAAGATIAVEDLTEFAQIQASLFAEN